MPKLLLHKAFVLGVCPAYRFLLQGLGQSNLLLNIWGVSTANETALHPRPTPFRLHFLLVFHFKFWKPFTLRINLWTPFFPPMHVSLMTGSAVYTISWEHIFQKKHAYSINTEIWMMYFSALDFQERSGKKQCEIENRDRLRGWQSHGMKVDLAVAGLRAPSVDHFYYSAGTRDQFVKKYSSRPHPQSCTSLHDSSVWKPFTSKAEESTQRAASSLFCVKQVFFCDKD